jgi:hypothetical protein
LTCPSPGIQIGSCIRMIPGATSVTSSDGGSCSCFGGLGLGASSDEPEVGSPGCRAVAVTAVQPTGEGQPYAKGASFGQGRASSRSAPAARQSMSR